MQLDILRSDEQVTHVALRGRLDVDGVQAVQNQFVFATAPRRRPTIVDLAQVPFLASLAIGMLISVGKALKPYGVPVILCAPTAMVAKTLHAAGIHHLMPIVASAEEALQLCQPG